MYGVENSRSKHYAESTCKVLDQKVVIQPYSTPDCKWYPTGSAFPNYYHHVVASWKVSFDDDANGTQVGRTYDYLASCPHYDTIPQHRLGLHPVNSTDVCYYDTNDYKNVRWSSPSETSQTYFIVMISFASAFLLVLVCLMGCKCWRPWETPRQRQERLDAQRQAELYNSLDGDENPN